MLTEELGKSLHHLLVKQDRLVAAPIDIVFDTVLNPVGPMADMGIKIEPWPGGRWFRDLGNNTGHLWGHVQVIKPPKLLEIWGPTMMSNAVVNHMQYRLSEEGSSSTRLQLTHRAMGMIEADHRDGLSKGFEFWIQRMKQLAETRAGKR